LATGYEIGPVHALPRTGVGNCPRGWGKIASRYAAVRAPPAPSRGVARLMAVSLIAAVSPAFRAAAADPASTLQA